jgi:alginate O-acetyltransferase complex protein AlgI
MVFSSPFFLFFFLPITLALTFVFRNSKYRNLILLIISAIFYIFGEGEKVILVFISITLNYFLGKWISENGSRLSIFVGVGLNILILVIFKYSAFILENLNKILDLFHINKILIDKITLPVGISFFTFHSISYLVDVYRRENNVQKSFIDLALYISLFPQLVAGPIIRYKDIASQFTGRVLKTHQFQLGIQRFIIGLAKKIIIANSLGFTADTIFNLDSNQLSLSASWIAIIFYTLQLYFDFSGYSDMAIGLAKMLGFDFMENFNFPYKAKSIRDFWQRWHISLSTWFRDYLYIPLGGNRVSESKVYFNLFIVFLLTGLWHGPSWNFVIWGLIHGAFMIVERLGFDKLLKHTGFFQHLYTLFIVIIAWIFFRIETFHGAMSFFKSLFYSNNSSFYTADMFLNRENLIALILGIILSINGVNWLLKKIMKIFFQNTNCVNSVKIVWRNIKSLVLIFIFIYSALNVMAGSYNPFIYFRF